MSVNRHIKEVLQQVIQQMDAAQLYYGHGTDNSTDEAVWLICHALGLSVHQALPDMDLNDNQQQQIAKLVADRIDSRKPAAYLTGSTWFAGLCFQVSDDVLVPRSPLAELIQGQFSPWLDSQAMTNVLDLGTGSGCIAIACAHYLPNCQVTGSDISQVALQLAEQNARQLNVGHRCRWFKSDVFDQLQGQCFDLIISNPPYVPDSRQQTLAQEYLQEPALGLYSGADGLNHAARILHQAAAHLQSGGYLILELGESAITLQQQLPMLAFIWPEFEYGGEGVLIADKALLQAHERDITDWYQNRMTNG